MARRPARGKTVGPTRRQGKLSMRAAKGGKAAKGKKKAKKKVTKRAAKRSKSSNGYTPPRIAGQQTSSQKDIPIRGILGSMVMNETRRRR